MVSQQEQELAASIFKKVCCYERTYRLIAARLLECPEFIALAERYILQFPNSIISDAIVCISLYLTCISITIEHPSIAQKKR
jgi:hypothetical protein